MVNQKGMQKMPVAKKKSVGKQGSGGPVGGGKIYGVHNPRGIEPQSIGGGMGSPVQMPKQPKVGK